MVGGIVTLKCVVIVMPPQIRGRKYAMPCRINKGFYQIGVRSVVYGVRCGCELW